MQTIKSFLDQSLVVWKEATAAARVGIALLLVLCIGAILVVGVWSAQPNYVALASDLSHDQLTKLMVGLDQANIGYEIKGAGSIIQVDGRQFDRASVIAGEQGISSAHVELEEASPWMDPVNQQNVYRRNLEKQLAASIEKLAPIEVATVHLSIPERQPFLRASLNPTASVVLKIAPKQRFSETQAASISTLVANAVPGLRPDQVAISDTQGNLYSNDETLGRLTKQEEFRINRERELVAKAQAMLINFLGAGNSQVEIAADFSFPEAKTTTTEYDPNKKVITSETVDSSTSTLDNPTGGGAAGINSNGISNANKKQVTSKTEVLNSQYEVSSTTREDVSRTPILNALTISVLVNSAKVQNEAKEIPESVKLGIEQLVKQAVGFRDGADRFSVEFFEFVDPLPEAEVTAMAIPWEQINSVLKNISLGVAALVALFLGLKVIKSLQPSTAPATATAALSSERGAQVNQLSEMVKQNPEVFSKIIAAWANDAQTAPGAETSRQKAA